MKVLRQLERIANPAARQQVGRWVGKGSWAIMDQGLFAVSNFALNILLARWLVPADYGAFSVAYTIFLLLGTFHTAILTEPMLVFGPGRYKERLGAYLAVLLRGHWVFGAMVGSLFAVSGLALWRFGSSPLIPAIFGLAVASPFILFQWLMRRACYLNLQPRLAAVAGAIYMALMAAGLFGLYYFAWLGAATALVVMAAASLVSGLWLVSQLGIVGDILESELLQESLNDHWTYGRWALGTAMVIWIPGNIYYLMLPLFSNLESTAAMQALRTLVMPMSQTLGAVSTLLLPSMSSTFNRSDIRTRRRIVFGSTIVFSACALLYWVFLGTFNYPLMALIYGEGYAEFSGLLWIAGISPLASGLAGVWGSVLRAGEKPRLVFIAFAYSSVWALTVGVVLMFLLGLTGAVIANVSSSFVACGVLIILSTKARIAVIGRGT